MHEKKEWMHSPQSQRFHLLLHREQGRERHPGATLLRRRRAALRCCHRRGNGGVRCEDAIALRVRKEQPMHDTCAVANAALINRNLEQGEDLRIMNQL